MTDVAMQPTATPRPEHIGRWITRSLLDRIESGLQAEACALLIGPYEVGKSMLATEVARRFGIAAHRLNASLEEDRAIMRGADGLLRNSPGQLLVIDEIQSFPDGLDLIRASLEAARDRREPVGRFLLLGSDIAQSQRIVAERLGTRAVTYRLSPIGLAEYLEPAGFAGAPKFGPIADTEPTPVVNDAVKMERLWLRGGLPYSLLADDDAVSFIYRERYIEKLCCRGYAQINPAWSPASIREILDRIAASQGEPFKVDRSKFDQKALLDHLEDLGLVRQLRPWFANQLKRFEKNPKVYIRDTGILHALLHRRSIEELRSDGNILGHSWEGFCIENLVEAAQSARPFFHRAENEQDEIDLVLEYAGGRRLAIEMKSKTAEVGAGFEHAVRTVSAEAPFVVRPVPESSQKSRYREMTLRDMVSFVRDFGR